MQLRQNYKGGSRYIAVQTLAQAQAIVALLNICYSYSVVMAKKQDISIREMSFCIADNHDLYGIVRDMFFDFGDCRFTLSSYNGVEYIMNVDRIEFEKPEETVG